MIAHEPELPNGLPFWNQPLLLLAAAEWSWDRLSRQPLPLLCSENEAYQRRSGDPTTDVYNSHRMWVGSQHALSDPRSIDIIHGLVAHECGFGKGDGGLLISAWNYQKPWLENLFKSYFRHGNEPGLVSLYTARRPSHLRKDETNGHVEIRQKRALVWSPGNKYNNNRDSILLGKERIPTEDLVLDCGSGAQKDQYTAIVFVPRAVEKSPSGSFLHRYNEWWCCSAVKDQEDVYLKKGIPPALASSPFYSEQSVLRNTPILNLAKLSVDQDNRYYRKNLALELSPGHGKGAISSLRVSELLLDLAMLIYCPIESIALYQALRKLPSWPNPERQYPWLKKRIYRKRMP